MCFCNWCWVSQAIYIISTNIAVSNPTYCHMLQDWNMTFPFCGPAEDTVNYNTMEKCLQKSRQPSKQLPTAGSAQLIQCAQANVSCLRFRKREIWGMELLSSDIASQQCECIASGLIFTHILWVAKWSPRASVSYHWDSDLGISPQYYIWNVI